MPNDLDVFLILDKSLHNAPEGEIHNMGIGKREFDNTDLYSTEKRDSFYNIDPSEKEKKEKKILLHYKVKRNDLPSNPTRVQRFDTFEECINDCIKRTHESVSTYPPNCFWSFPYVLPFEVLWEHYQGYELKEENSELWTSFSYEEYKLKKSSNLLSQPFRLFKSVASALYNVINQTNDETPQDIIKSKCD